MGAVAGWEQESRDVSFSRDVPSPKPSAPHGARGWALHILGFSATRQGRCGKSDPIKLNFEQIIQEKVSVRPATVRNKYGHKKQPDDRLIKVAK